MEILLCQTWLTATAISAFVTLNFTDYFLANSQTLVHSQRCAQLRDTHRSASKIDLLNYFSLSLTCRGGSVCYDQIRSDRVRQNRNLPCSIPLLSGKDHSWTKGKWGNNAGAVGSIYKSRTTAGYWIKRREKNKDLSRADANQVLLLLSYSQWLSSVKTWTSVYCCSSCMWTACITPSFSLSSFLYCWMQLLLGMRRPWRLWRRAYSFLFWADDRAHSATTYL